MEKHALKDPRSFVKAGKAIFTILNTNTNGRFTFKVKKCEDKDLWFVSVLNGSNNDTDYTYIGTIFGTEFRRTGKSRVGKDATSFKAFDWFWRHADRLPENVEVHHEGRCGRCGRRLTVPSSVESGYGPECLGKVA